MFPRRFARCIFLLFCVAVLVARACTGPEVFTVQEQCLPLFLEDASVDEVRACCEFIRASAYHEHLAAYMQRSVKIFNCVP